ncbi:MAG: periplasmic heavy metal sensor [Alphaproteobacteria bacterium]|nr:periplasmic heavy metal sensor [Alphaproteobacteria bacterium]MDX5416883.1 periplasmic heavy metal sensor [Alphaproteobacteria bacterium]MDX5494278.1 periplasmic heavy metal sensor [Alphaproteobacteria bacterium]
MSEMTPAPAGKPVRRWLGPALLVSLAFNLFLVALISVPFFKGPRDAGFGPMPRGHGAALMHGAFRELPDEDRQELRRAMREKFREIRPYFREMHEARNALADALAAEPYDEVAVRAAFDGMSAAMTAMSDMGRDAMMETFARLTPEQRKRVAETMRKDRDRMMRWRKDGSNGAADDMPPPPME